MHERHFVVIGLKKIKKLKIKIKKVYSSKELPRYPQFTVQLVMHYFACTSNTCICDYLDYHRTVILRVITIYVLLICIFLHNVYCYHTLGLSFNCISPLNLKDCLVRGKRALFRLLSKDSLVRLPR